MPIETMKNEDAAYAALVELLSAMELVFDNDWECTKANIGDDPDGIMIARNGTFLNPRVEDEQNNWANRAVLLEAYRNAQIVCEELMAGRPVVRVIDA